MAVNYDYRCIPCDEVSILSSSYEERDKQVCPTCGSVLQRLISMPATTKASYVDGTKRKGWADMREASKLNREAADSRPERAKEIAKEIRKIGVDIRR